MTAVDLEQFITQVKLNIYSRIFVELYNERNHREIHQIYRMIEFEK